VTRHIVFGGSGFTGRHLCEAISSRGGQTILCDERVPAFPLPDGATFRHVDITVPQTFDPGSGSAGDIVYNLAARQFHNQVPARNQDEWFAEVNARGTENILEWMSRHDVRKLVALSTDMVYGIPIATPVAPNHPRNPLGPYGRSKRMAEDLCIKARAVGMQVSILRPRMIIGPGRLGVLVKLFKLIERGLPVPLIGNGKNYYQMISVYDVVSAIVACTDAGVPNVELNLGSSSPPTVRDLLEESISRAKSGSHVISTPASAVKWVLALLEKLGRPLLHKEQFSIADVDFLVDIEATRVALGWEPRYSDADMLYAAYAEYKANIQKVTS
jgi:nucleoside-diphosphate-sugar epimerase